MGVITQRPGNMTGIAIWLALAGWLGFGSWTHCLADGKEVVVIYNSALAESKSLAYHYARQRGVPAEQVLGFKLTTGETISREDFRDDLQRPLTRKIEALKLWRVGVGEVPGTNGRPARAIRKVVASKIRYAVLCYGVPLKILRDDHIHEALAETTRPELRRNEAAVDSNSPACR